MCHKPTQSMHDYVHAHTNLDNGVSHYMSIASRCEWQIVCFSSGFCLCIFLSCSELYHFKSMQCLVEKTSEVNQSHI